MTDSVEIPVYGDDGKPTGETVLVAAPPPEVVEREDGLVSLELQQFEELVRFGCGCYREQRLAYVARRPVVGARSLPAPD